MSLSEILIKVIGIILAVVGLLLLLAVVGLGSVVGLVGGWFVWNLILGIAFIAVGVYLVRGGSINL